MKQGNTNNRVDKAWGRMEHLLDEEMPKKRRWPLFILWFLVGLTAAILSTSYIKDLDKATPGQDIAQSQTEITSTSHLISEEDSNPVTENGILEVTQSEVYQNSKAANADDNSSIKSETEVLGEARDKVVEADNETSSVVTQQTEVKNTVPVEVISTTTNQIRDASSTDIAYKSGSAKPSINYPNEAGPVLTQNKIDEVVPLEGITASSDINQRQLPEMALLAFTNESLLEFDKAVPVMSIDLANSLMIEPVLVGMPKARLSLDLMGERISDFSSNGYGFGLSLDKPIARKWSLGLGVAYFVNRRTPDFSRAVDPLTADVPEGLSDPQGNEIEVLFAGDPEEIQLASTNKLDNLAAHLHIKYKPISQLSIYSGIALERYFNVSDIQESAFQEDLNLSNEVYYTVAQSPKNIASLDFGVEYRPVSWIGIFSQYRNALADLYSFTEGKSFSSNKYIAGIRIAL